MKSQIKLVFNHYRINALIREINSICNRSINCNQLSLIPIGYAAQHLHTENLPKVFTIHLYYICTYILVHVIFLCVCNHVHNNVCTSNMHKFS